MINLINSFLKVKIHVIINNQIIIISCQEGIKWKTFFVMRYSEIGLKRHNREWFEKKLIDNILKIVRPAAVNKHMKGL